MKTTKLFLIAIAFTAGLFFTACEEDDETSPKPDLDLHQLGYGDSQTAFKGADLHIEAEIIAEENIDKVTVKIDPKVENEEKSTLEEGEWTVDTTYAKFSEMKNTEFHEHIKVPVDAEAGNYHFLFAATDMNGQEAVVEKDLEIKQPNDSIAPKITVSSAPDSGAVFNKGETIAISGSVSDETALGAMYIGLVREDQDLVDSDMIATNTITLLHTHELDNPTSHDFSVSIEVGAEKDNNPDPTDLTVDLDGGPAWQSADYYLLIKSVDAFGGNWTYSDHYPIELSID